MKNFKIKADSVSWFCEIALGSLLLGFAQTSATAFTLDAFTDVESGTSQIVAENEFNGVIDVFPSTDTDTGLPAISVAGGNRHLKVTTSDTTDSGQISISDGELDFTTGNNVSATGLLVWNGSSTVDFDNLNANANLNLDLQKDGDGDDSFFVRIDFADETFNDSNDMNMGYINITLYDGSNTWTVQQDVDPVPTSSSGQSLQYQFSDFSNNGVNINSIDYVALEINGLEASDLGLEFFATEDVPFEFSPTLGLILGGSLFGFLKIRKNLQRSKSL